MSARAPHHHGCESVRWVSFPVDIIMWLCGPDTVRGSRLDQSDGGVGPVWECAVKRRVVVVVIIIAILPTIIAVDVK